MKWFGESWGAPVCDLDDHTDTPVGILCAGAEQPDCPGKIREGDQGLITPYLYYGNWADMPWHLDCFLRNIGVPAYRK